MSDHFNIRLQAGRIVSASLLAYFAHLAEIHGGGYLHVTDGLELPSIPARALPRVEQCLREHGVPFSVFPSDVFSEGAGI